MKRVCTIGLAAIFLMGCGAFDCKWYGSKRCGGDSDPSIATTSAVVQPAATQAVIQAPADPVTLNVVNAEVLPTCDGTREGVLAYVRADHDFMICEGGEWVSVDARGTDGMAGVQGDKGDKGDRGDPGLSGMQGIQGAQGMQGVAGIDGIDTHFVTRWECSGTANDNTAYFGALPTYAYTVEYNVDVTDYGDVMISARIMNGNGQWATAKALPKNHVDAEAARIQYLLNLAGGSVNCGIWTVTLNRATNQMTMRYDDADMINLGGVYSKTVSCTKITY